jgi:hypothetical protein
VLGSFAPSFNPIRYRNSNRNRGVVSWKIQNFLTRNVHAAVSAPRGPPTIARFAADAGPSTTYAKNIQAWPSARRTPRRARYVLVCR